MECVFNIKRINKELKANVTAGFDGIVGAYFIWAVKDGADFKQYYSEHEVRQARYISIIENSFIASAREAWA